MDTISRDNDTLEPPVSTAKPLAKRRSTKAVHPESSDHTFFLKRLDRLARLSHYADAHPHFSPEEARLLRWSTYSTYRDCVGLGIGTKAQVVLRDAKHHTPV